MSLKTQAKVLRALQEQRIEPVGGAGGVDVDVRVIAATNKDLEAEIRAGRFREDLYFRLNVIPFQVPPLRERREDIPLLTRHFLQLLSAEHGRRPREVSDEALAVLARLPWPGNVRELRNILERLVIMTPGERIELRHLPASLATLRRQLAPEAAGRARGRGDGRHAAGGARGVRAALHPEPLPRVRRQHEPHRRGARRRALEPLPQDEGLRAA